MKIGSPYAALTKTPCSIQPLSAEASQEAAAEAAQQFRDFLEGKWITVEYRTPADGLHTDKASDVLP